VELGTQPGEPVALVVVAGVGIGLATVERSWAVASADPSALVAPVAGENAPRWVWWSARVTAAPLVSAGIRLTTCWDLSAVHRLLYGGWRDDPARVWAAVHGLDEHGLPTTGQLDLLASGSTDDGDPREPVRPDGYLRPDWAAQEWLSRRAGGPSDELLLERAARWAALALEVQARHCDALKRLPDGRRTAYPPPLPVLTARSESTADLLSVELAADGLPVDRAEAETVVARFIGARPADRADEASQRARRDGQVQRHFPDGSAVDLRNPAQVRVALTSVGIDLPDTRSWRLEQFRGAHPVVDALLAWRRADRVATTYGFHWLDRHVAADGRLRGMWTGSDGAAGRMTAQAGLHSLPAELRTAVRAERGHVFVRADLGQVEPRVLAAVSGDRALATATAADDLYLPVADQLGCDRPTAKVAVLAAMYGQTSGTAGQALRRMERAYPVALRYLRAADESGRAGRDVRTYGGRLVRMWRLTDESVDESARRSAVAGRGRFARNAVIQGAAAELFKMWAATVRAETATYDARIVLCLHDELLVHAPERHGERIAQQLQSALGAVAERWGAGSGVRFVADVAVVSCWADAKT
jgi:DNA polymerase-1